TALIVELAASRCIELALLTARLGLTQARLRRRCGVVVFFAAGQTSRQALQETHRTTVFMLGSRGRRTVDLSLNLRREIGDLRHARLLLLYGSLMVLRLRSCGDRLLLRSSGGGTQNLRLNRLLHVLLRLYLLYLRLNRSARCYFRLNRTEQVALRLEGRCGR